MELCDYLQEMSRRASVFARQNPGRRRVRFPDEIVFEESIKGSVSAERRKFYKKSVNRQGKIGIIINFIQRNFIP
jgi:hypothetical protein